LYKDLSVELKKNYLELSNNLRARYFFFLKEYVSNIDFLEGEYSMTNEEMKEFVKIAKCNGNMKKIQQIMDGGKYIPEYLRKLAEKIIEDFQDFKYPGENPFTMQKQIWAVAKFQGKYHSDIFVIDVLVDISGFKISIYEDGKKIEERREILNKILPEFEKEYKIYINEDVDDKNERAHYNKRLFDLDEYDELIDVLKQILGSFVKYSDNGTSPIAQT